jgi:hypothetical protein
MGIQMSSYAACNMSSYAICNKCHWIHYKVSRQQAEEQVIKFNEYFDKLSLKEQEKFFGEERPHIKKYESCHLCAGSYKNFREGTEEDDKRAYGCTISPIIGKEE